MAVPVWDDPVAATLQFFTELRRLVEEATLTLISLGGFVGLVAVIARMAVDPYRGRGRHRTTHSARPRQHISRRRGRRRAPWFRRRSGRPRRLE
ncbi:hypothetical protein [Nonomuraea endophytica]|uniref:hypothetical protein n=1 Tax=Nonomuraea endophytica TaxID=714136 RepID=UPI0037C63612